MTPFEQVPLPPRLSAALKALDETIGRRDYGALDERLRETIAAVERFKRRTQRRVPVVVAPEAVYKIEEAWDVLMDAFVEVVQELTDGNAMRTSADPLRDALSEMRSALNDAGLVEFVG